MKLEEAIEILYQYGCIKAIDCGTHEQALIKAFNVFLKLGFAVIDGKLIKRDCILSKDEIRKEFDKFIEVGENKLKMMYDSKMSNKITEAILNAQKNKLSKIK